MNMTRAALVFLVILALPLAACKEEKTAAPAAAPVAVNEEGAAALMAQAAMLHGAASQLRSYWLCLDEEISFDSMRDPTQTTYDNDTAPDEFRCHVFHIISGMKDSDVTPDIIWLDEEPVDQPYYGQWYFNGSHAAGGLGMGDGTDNDRELVAFLPYVLDDVCAGINAKLGISGPVPAVSGLDWNAPFRGRYTLGGGDELPGLMRMAGCVNDGTKNVFYQVLLVR